MGSALLNPETGDSTFAAPAATSAGMPTPGQTAAVRLQAAERLAAHRSRHGHTQPRTAPEPVRPATTRSARIAAAVAERYAHTQSYRAFLAAEAERAVQQARAAAEIAALNAQAVAAAQQSLLDTFDQAAIDQTEMDQHAAGQDAPHTESHADPQQGSQAARSIPQDRIAAPQQAEPPQPRPVELSLWPDLDAQPTERLHHSRTHRSTTNPEPRTSNLPLTVRLYEDASSAAYMDLEAARRATSLAHSNRIPSRIAARCDDETRALDEEIAFRQAPVFEEPAGPPMPLPANLIEFPRQLVASRKARPRLAEGPLRDDAGAAPLDGQLRIFEVDPAQISTTPAAETESDAAETTASQWTSIWLDTPTTRPPAMDAPGALHPEELWVQGQSQPSAAGADRHQTAPLPGVASIGRRTLAAAINAAIVLTGVLAFAAVFLAVAAHILPWQPGPLDTLFARISAGAGLQPGQLPIAVAVTAGSLLVLYQALFFWFSAATPGMRCARIALCTFDDENPTRKAMRRRMLAVLLSACPLGFGFLWAALDEDRLTWHDRLARMYQRSY